METLFAERELLAGPAGAAHFAYLENNGLPLLPVPPMAMKIPQVWGTG